MNYQQDFLSKLPAVEFPPRLDLTPDAPGVYIVANDNGVVTYVGSSKSIRSRWQCHEKVGPLKDLAKHGIHFRVFFLLTQDYVEQEKALIQQFNPLLNRRGVNSQNPAPQKDRRKQVVIKLQDAEYKKLSSAAESQGTTLYQVALNGLRQEFLDTQTSTQISTGYHHTSSKGPKKQYNTRIEPEAIENLQFLKESLNCSIPDIFETLIYWLAGNDRALEDCPLRVREAIAARGGNEQPSPENLRAAFESALAPLVQRLESIESEMKNEQEAIAPCQQ